MTFHGIKTFSATRARERGALGDRVTEWIDGHPDVEVKEAVVTQSSDREFHCLTITIFYDEPQQKRRSR